MKLDQKLLVRAQRKLIRICRQPFWTYRAYLLLHEVYRRKRSDALVIFSFEHIGGTLCAMSCLKALREKYPEKIIIAVGSAKQEELLASYGELIDELVITDDPKWLPRIRAFLDSSLISEKGLALDIFNGTSFVYNPYNHTGNFDCLHTLQTHVFQVGEDAPITYHGLRGDGTVTAVEDFQRKKGKMVIINPYSISCGQANRFLYEKMVYFLSERGFEVYTNVVGEQTAIAGSRELRCSLPELYTIAKEIPLIVSIRCGILDFLAPTNIDMFVIYENCARRWEQMYSLESWRCGGRIREWFTTDSEEEQEAILQEFEGFVESL